MENALSALSTATSTRPTAPRPPAAPKPAELPMVASALTLAPANPPSAGTDLWKPYAEPILRKHAPATGSTA